MRRATEKSLFQLVFYISLFYWFGSTDRRVGWGKRAGDKWLIRPLLEWLFQQQPTQVNAQVLQKSRDLRTAGVLPVCSPVSEDDIWGQVQSTASFPQCSVSVSSSETYWTRQVSVRVVTLSRLLVQSPFDSCKFG